MGTACVFTKTTGAWKQTAELTGSDTVDGDQFGSEVAISGTTSDYVVVSWVFVRMEAKMRTGTEVRAA